ncbi:hypothetical protein RirG_073520 [Rhizophagus irregularis DAOM 197198w]|nr:hypothetical protein RirG_073520 [Rhizophagus irregularis DAOM 197198w]
MVNGQPVEKVRDITLNEASETQNIIKHDNNENNPRKILFSPGLSRNAAKKRKPLHKYLKKPE